MKILCTLVLTLCTSAASAQFYSTDIVQNATPAKGMYVGSSTFSYNGLLLNTYGFGFHSFNDGTDSGYLNAYVSSYYGIDFFTQKLRRFRINANGAMTAYNYMSLTAGATVASDVADTNPNYSWNTNLSVWNYNANWNTFSKITFGSNATATGGIAVRRTGEYTGDMYLQVRNSAGNYYTPVLIKSDGKVGINTETPDESLTVRGTIHTAEVKVDTDSDVYPDYVFEENYQLRSLNDLADFIKQNKHLPEIPTAKDAKENGIFLKQMNLLLLKKIEELTLYQIESNKQIASLKKEVEQLKKN